MLSRLNVTALAFATVSVFAFGLVDSTSAMAKSPVRDEVRDRPIPLQRRPAPRVGISLLMRFPAMPRRPTLKSCCPNRCRPALCVTYKRIFTLQNAGSYAQADRLISHLSDSTLLGAVLAARYLSDELYQLARRTVDHWYARYSHQPEAPAIYALMRRKLHRHDLPPPPRLAFLPEQTTTTGAVGASRLGDARHALAAAFRQRAGRMERRRAE